MNERGGGGGHSVSHVSIFLKDKSKTLPTLTFAVFTFLQNVCPLPSQMRSELERDPDEDLMTKKKKKEG